MESSTKDASSSAAAGDTTECWDTVHVTPSTAERDLATIAVSRCFVLHASPTFSLPFSSSLHAAAAAEEDPSSSMSTTVAASSSVAPDSGVLDSAGVSDKANATPSLPSAEKGNGSQSHRFDDSDATAVHTTGKTFGIYRRVRVIHNLVPCLVRCSIDNGNTTNTTVNHRTSNALGNMSAASTMPPLLATSLSSLAHLQQQVLQQQQRQTDQSSSSLLQNSFHSIFDAAAVAAADSNSTVPHMNVPAPPLPLSQGSSAVNIPLQSSNPAVAAASIGTPLHRTHLTKGNTRSALQRRSRASSRRSHTLSYLLAEGVIFADPVEVVADAAISFVDVHFAAHVTVRGSGPVQFVNCTFSHRTTAQLYQQFVSRPSVSDANGSASSREGKLGSPESRRRGDGGGGGDAAVAASAGGYSKPAAPRVNGVPLDVNDECSRRSDDPLDWCGLYAVGAASPLIAHESGGGDGTNNKGSGGHVACRVNSPPMKPSGLSTDAAPVSPGAIGLGKGVELPIAMQVMQTRRRSCHSRTTHGSLSSQNSTNAAVAGAGAGAGAALGSGGPDVVASTAPPPAESHPTPPSSSSSSPKLHFASTDHASAASGGSGSLRTFTNVLDVCGEVQCVLSQCDLYGGGAGASLVCCDNSRVSVTDSSFDGPSITWAAIEVRQSAEVSIQHVNVQQVMGVGLLATDQGRAMVDSSVINRCGIAGVVATDNAAVVLHNTGIEASISGVCVSMSGSAIGQMVGCGFTTRYALSPRVLYGSSMEHRHSSKSCEGDPFGRDPCPLRDTIDQATSEQLLQHALHEDLGAMLGSWLMHAGTADMAFSTSSQSVVLTDRATATVMECEFTSATRLPPSAVVTTNVNTSSTAFPHHATSHFAHSGAGSGVDIPSPSGSHANRSVGAALSFTGEPAARNTTATGVGVGGRPSSATALPTTGNALANERGGGSQNNSNLSHPFSTASGNSTITATNIASRKISELAAAAECEDRAGNSVNRGHHSNHHHHHAGDGGRQRDNDESVVAAMSGKSLAAATASGEPPLPMGSMHNASRSSLGGPAAPSSDGSPVGAFMSLGHSASVPGVFARAGGSGASSGVPPLASQSPSSATSFPTASPLPPSVRRVMAGLLSTYIQARRVFGDFLASKRRAHAGSAASAAAIPLSDAVLAAAVTHSSHGLNNLTSPRSSRSPPRKSTKAETTCSSADSNSAVAPHLCSSTAVHRENGKLADSSIDTSTLLPQPLTMSTTRPTRLTSDGHGEGKGEARELDELHERDMLHGVNRIEVGELFFSFKSPGEGEGDEEGDDIASSKLPTTPGLAPPPLAPASSSLPPAAAKCQLRDLSIAAMQSLQVSLEQMGCLDALMAPHGGVYHVVLSQQASLALLSSVLILSAPQQLLVTVPRSWTYPAGVDSSAGALSSTICVPAAPFVAAVLSYQAPPPPPLAKGETGKPVVAAPSSGEQTGASAIAPPSEAQEAAQQAPPRAPADQFCSLITQSNVIRYECVTVPDVKDRGDVQPHPTSLSQPGSMTNNNSNSRVIAGPRADYAQQPSSQPVSPSASTRQSSPSSQLPPHLLTGSPRPLCLSDSASSTASLQFNTAAWGLVMIIPPEDGDPVKSDALSTAVRMQAEHWCRMELTGSPTRVMAHSSSCATTTTNGGGAETVAAGNAAHPDSPLGTPETVEVPSLCPNTAAPRNVPSSLGHSAHIAAASSLSAGGGASLNMDGTSTDGGTTAAAASSDMERGCPASVADTLDDRNTGVQHLGNIFLNGANPSELLSVTQPEHICTSFGCFAHVMQLPAAHNFPAPVSPFLSRGPMAFMYDPLNGSSNHRHHRHNAAPQEEEKAVSAPAAEANVTGADAALNTTQESSSAVKPVPDVSSPLSIPSSPVGERDVSRMHFSTDAQRQMLFNDVDAPPLFAAAVAAVRDGEENANVGAGRASCSTMKAVGITASVKSPRDRAAETEEKAKKGNRSPASPPSSRMSTPLPEPVSGGMAGKTGTATAAAAALATKTSVVESHKTGGAAMADGRQPTALSNSLSSVKLNRVETAAAPPPSVAVKTADATGAPWPALPSAPSVSFIEVESISITSTPSNSSGSGSASGSYAEQSYCNANPHNYTQHQRRNQFACNTSTHHAPHQPTPPPSPSHDPLKQYQLQSPSSPNHTPVSSIGHHAHQRSSDASATSPPRQYVSEPSPPATPRLPATPSPPVAEDFEYINVESESGSSPSSSDSDMLSSACMHEHLYQRREPFSSAYSVNPQGSHEHCARTSSAHPRSASPTMAPPLQRLPESQTVRTPASLSSNDLFHAAHLRTMQDSPHKQQKQQQHQHRHHDGHFSSHNADGGLNSSEDGGTASTLDEATLGRMTQFEEQIAQLQRVVQQQQAQLAQMQSAAHHQQQFPPSPAAPTQQPPSTPPPLVLTPQDETCAVNFRLSVSPPPSILRLPMPFLTPNGSTTSSKNMVVVLETRDEPVVARAASTGSSNASLTKTTPNEKIGEAVGVSGAITDMDTTPTVAAAAAAGAQPTQRAEPKKLPDTQEKDDPMLPQPVVVNAAAIAASCVAASTRSSHSSGSSREGVAVAPISGPSSASSASSASSTAAVAVVASTTTSPHSTQHLRKGREKAEGIQRDAAPALSEAAAVTPLQHPVEPLPWRKKKWPPIFQHHRSLSPVLSEVDHISAADAATSLEHDVPSVARPAAAPPFSPPPAPPSVPPPTQRLRVARRTLGNTLERLVAAAQQSLKHKPDEGAGHSGHVFDVAADSGTKHASLPRRNGTVEVRGAGSLAHQPATDIPDDDEEAERRRWELELMRQLTAATQRSTVGAGGQRGSVQRWRERLSLASPTHKKAEREGGSGAEEADWPGPSRWHTESVRGLKEGDDIKETYFDGDVRVWPSLQRKARMPLTSHISNASSSAATATVSPALGGVAYEPWRTTVATGTCYAHLPPPHPYSCPSVSDQSSRLSSDKYSHSPEDRTSGAAVLTASPRRWHEPTPPPPTPPPTASSTRTSPNTNGGGGRGGAGIFSFPTDVTTPLRDGRPRPMYTLTPSTVSAPSVPLPLEFPPSSQRSFAALAAFPPPASPTTALRTPSAAPQGMYVSGARQHQQRHGCPVAQADSYGAYHTSSATLLPPYLMGSAQLPLSASSLAHLYDDHQEDRHARRAWNAVIAQSKEAERERQRLTLPRQSEQLDRLYTQPMLIRKHRAAQNARYSREILYQMHGCTFTPQINESSRRRRLRREHRTHPPPQQHRRPVSGPGRSGLSVEAWADTLPGVSSLFTSAHTTNTTTSDSGASSRYAAAVGRDVGLVNRSRASPR